MNEIFEIDQWLSPKEISTLRDIVKTWTSVPSIAKEGHFPGQLIANQSWHQWDHSDEIGKIIGTKLDCLFQDYAVVECVYQELFLPWDIHADYDRPTKFKSPWYSVLIPLESYDSNTIIFDQIAEYNDFWKYKQISKPANNPIDLDFWNNHLGFCWDDDRQYLSVRHVSKPWSAGNILCFPRNLLHSSDAFHKKILGPKCFIQILLDKI